METRASPIVEDTAVLKSNATNFDITIGDCDTEYEYEENYNTIDILY